MAKNLEGQQVMVLPEGSNRVLGRDAQRINIAVAYAVANIVRTTLGPILRGRAIEVDTILPHEGPGQGSSTLRLARGFPGNED